MNTGILHLHSALPYLLLALLIASLIGNIIAWRIVNDVDYYGNGMNDGFCMVGLIKIHLRDEFSFVCFIVGVQSFNFFFKHVMATFLPKQRCGKKDNTARIGDSMYFCMVCNFVLIVHLSNSKSKH